MPIQYSLDLDNERSIYEEPERRYVILPDRGHFYDGIPVKINVTREQISYETTGLVYSYLRRDYPCVMVRGSIDGDNIPLTSLSFEWHLPETGELISYDWPTIGISTQLFPE